tara:strand:- start:10390 stop:10590 length:201 start_codon:yes stop_codon:yes gene_type:complete
MEVPRCRNNEFTMDSYGRHTSQNKKLTLKDAAKVAYLTNGITFRQKVLTKIAIKNPVTVIIPSPQF